MRANDIHVGQTLEVKAHVRESSQMPDGSEVPVLIRVERIVYPSGRRIPWIHAAGGQFRPSELEPIR